MAKRIRPTLTRLNEILTDIQVPVTVTKGHCETYGRATMCYIRVADMAERFRVEQALDRMGVYTNHNYCRRSGNCAVESPRIEIRVSYLRASGWNE
jgi:hypothetical protein